MRHRKLFPALCLLFVTACSGGLQEAYDDSQHSSPGITPAWVIGPKAPCKIATVAGGGSDLTANGIAATDAKLSQPQGIAVDAAGNVYYADSGLHCVRKVDTDGQISTVAGICGTTGMDTEGQLGEMAATEVRLFYPLGVALLGNTLYIADTNSYCVRKVNLSNMRSIRIAGECRGTATAQNWSSVYENQPAVDTRFSAVRGLAVDAWGDLYIGASSRIIKISSGIAATLTGGNYVDNYGVALDGYRNVFIADTYNKCIRKYTRATGVESIEAGACSSSAAGAWTDDDTVMEEGVVLNGTVSGIAADSQGNYYFLEPGVSPSYVGRIRRIDAGTKRITTIAGGGSETDATIENAATASLIFKNISNLNLGLTLAPDGSLYFSDWTDPPRIRKCTPQ